MIFVWCLMQMGRKKRTIQGRPRWGHLYWSRQHLWSRRLSKPDQDVGDKWVCFNDESPQRPPPPSEGEPAPPLPHLTSPAEPAPPLPKSHPLIRGAESSFTKISTSSCWASHSPPSIESPKDSLPPVPPVTKDTTPLLQLSPPPPVEEAPPPPKPMISLTSNNFSPCAPLIETQSDSTNSPPTTVETSERTIPPPLVLNQEDRRTLRRPHQKRSQVKAALHPKRLVKDHVLTPPPPPPPTYKAVVSSPGPIPPAVQVKMKWWVLSKKKKTVNRASGHRTLKL